ncbi:16S rRNA (adenine(1518)-N(6)/adenine(1519)-N(6))-dimethyltransferase RsmA [Derxia lacustris]|uniref:16S rRNA (adenine(1518)-N(6)/adenine(1519)-N(6))- dimethyltransferase RsmA n=1 Tax=Derxia lacustris TaxID=764842 RepID=UPI000A1728DF|nr:16S rRNA (adenine(1518)-N(6)/adenine(1519)-N(6))-dimethyltransferase RsmA [Derxia lacustris]
MEHRARKRFGQNFLVDQGIVQAIVGAVAPAPGDAVIEIGPGLGALTRVLLAEIEPAERPMHVVEIDRDLIARLNREYAPEDLVVHAGDALQFDFAGFARGMREAGRRVRVVGNLPYNISSPLLFHLVAAAPWVEDQHFMLQREVVERMVSAPGDSEFGRLSVMLQYRYEMEQVLDVPPESFDPAPKVDSAVVRMRPRPAAELGAVNEKVFAQVVAAGFSQRRKMLRNTLNAYVIETGGAEVAEGAGIRLTARAEDIGVEAWVAFANAVAQTREKAMLAK